MEFSLFIIFCNNDDSMATTAQLVMSVAACRNVLSQARVSQIHPGNGRFRLRLTRPPKAQMISIIPLPDTAATSIAIGEEFTAPLESVPAPTEYVSRAYRRSCYSAQKCGRSAERERRKPPFCCVFLCNPLQRSGVRFPSAPPAYHRLRACSESGQLRMNGLGERIDNRHAARDEAALHIF